MFGNHGLGGLPEEGAHEKSPKCLGGNLGDFGEFCKGLGKAKVAEQIKGISSITTATLMAMLPELGRLNHKRLASLVGIAPHPRESGETKFKSRCFGGRSAVRKALYMATVVATRFEPLIRDFYQRLLSKGKPYKVAVTACMRKLLTVLNARMRDYFAENGTTENGIRTA